MLLSLSLFAIYVIIYYSVIKSVVICYLGTVPYDIADMGRVFAGRR